MKIKMLMIFVLVILPFQEAQSSNNNGQSGNNNDQNRWNTDRTRHRGRHFTEMYTRLFYSSFSTTPSTFTWEALGTWTETTLPSRPVPLSSIPAERGPVSLSPSGPNCLSFPLTSIYRGNCSATSSIVPYISGPEPRFSDGAKCFEKQTQFTINYKTGANVEVQETIIVQLPESDSYSTSNPSVGLTDVSCSQFKRLNGTAFDIPGKVVKGSASFKCVSGEWKLSQLSCNDLPATCRAQTFRFPYGGYTGNAPLPNLTEGQTTVSSCSVLGTPPANSVWRGSLSYSCNGYGNFIQSGGSCETVLVQNFNQPNCIGGNLVSGFYTSAYRSETVCLSGQNVCQWSSEGSCRGYNGDYYYADRRSGSGGGGGGFFGFGGGGGDVGGDGDGN